MARGNTHVNFFLYLSVVNVANAAVVWHSVEDINQTNQVLEAEKGVAETVGRVPRNQIPMELAIARSSPWAAAISSSRAARGLAEQPVGHDRHHALLLAKFVGTTGFIHDQFDLRAEDGVMRWDRLLGLAIFLSFVGFGVWGSKDVYSFLVFCLRSRRIPFRATQAPQYGGASSSTDVVESVDGPKLKNQKPWPLRWIIGLTSYRFYTGFLTATWLPYLLAMQGQDLWREKQSLFMGIAKLIYGMTILLNPILGLVGDQAVLMSHSTGRRLFVRVGVIIAVLGLLLCHVAGEEHALLTFLCGILVWRLGEAINDVTTEAVVPEMVPASQFQVASAIKACSFLFGGLFGYVLLILLADLHYGWLYYAYPVGMLLCAIPSLMMLGEDPSAAAAARQEPVAREGFLAAVSKAYVGPMRFKGGFPRACLAVFVFSLGTAPMFFLLLIVRDLVGITNPIVLQQQFSLSSIVFFLSAAVASMLIGVSGRGNASQLDQGEILRQRGMMLVHSMIAFGLLALGIPAITLLETLESRDCAFHIVAALFGIAFGSAFTRFQDITWQLLPPGADVANAMGFNVMSRLLGLGIGNFLAGLILDSFYLGGSFTNPASTWQHYKGWHLEYSNEKVEPVYSPFGYVVMCTCCAMCVFASSAIAYSAIGAARAELEAVKAPRSPTSA
mmetsp:Transcript_46197/g.100387  ORF Transcript_46197/g.100387 Transcript_46197/m.100387 type:complete len:671 (+) Transcript_46197:164-2176(+)|eukprot:CAMPEP_0170581224 /NCGR_PEP_ID=MMETSP0224-20130122/6925_1 /TAXON_ID=285029 /ORGANISM="Togula jolla, Strain CCCM 725" /LENGTH=670 /DNA_ID=CAMNT_0010904345 /DNA_START=163 /DNA_END=2175 /DNA_ORIENTATION=+